MIRACESCGQKNRVPPTHLADTGRCGKCQAALPPLRVPLNASEEDFDAIIAGATMPVLVDFWASWCGPCRAAAPMVAEVAAKRAGRALVLKVDVDQNQRLAQRYRIRGIPAFLVFSGGDVKTRHAGVAPVGQMEAWLDSVS